MEGKCPEEVKTHEVLNSSTAIGGAELGIGGAQAPTKRYKVTPIARRVHPWLEPGSVLLSFHMPSPSHIVISRDIVRAMAVKAVLLHGTLTDAENSG